LKINKLGVEKVKFPGNIGKVTRQNGNPQTEVNLTISELAKKIESMGNSISASSAEKIEQISNLIQKGEYKIDADRIARALLGLPEKR